MIDRPSRRFSRAVFDTLEDRRLLTASNRVTNGDFSAAGAGWTLSGNVYASAAGSTPNSPPGYAYFSGSAGTAASSVNTTGTLSQTVSIPAGATSAWLDFWYRFTTEETSAAANDTLKLVLKNAPTGATLATPYTVSSSTDFARDVYTQSPSIDVGAYAGQSITISFVSQNNATLGTIFRVDDVTLQAEVPGAAPTLAAPIEIQPGTLTSTAAPTLNTPVPNLRWNDVAGAAGYGVLIEKLNTTSGKYAPAANSEVSLFASPIKGASFSPPHKLLDGTYRWQVRTFDSTGKATAYAPALYFKLNTTGYTRAVGIDISNYQTVSSWASVKTNGTSDPSDDTSFVYAKASEGLSFNDAKFATFVPDARANGVVLGGYHFARPSNNAAVDEAVHFYNRLVAVGALNSTSSTPNLIPMLDFEDEDATGLGRAALSTWLNAFCDKFVSLSGIVPVVYTFVSYATDYLNTSVIRYPLWQAQYPSSASDAPIPNGTSRNPSSVKPWLSGGWSMWQWTSTRPVAGVGTVDSDVANADFATYLDAFRIPSTATYTVTGTVFNDANNDGVRNAGEAAVSGRTVFLDANGDGVFNSGESNAITTSAGTYSFTNLRQGNYQVRQVVPGGSVSTTPQTVVFKLGAGLANAAHDFGSRLLDVTPPILVASNFAYDAAPPVVTLVFSEDVGATFVNADAVLVNTTTGEAVATTLTYTAADRTAVFTPLAPLINGDYTLTIAAGNIADAAGNLNAAMTVNFFSLAGDVNRDRVVDFDDLVALSQAYGQPGTFAQGDLNADGNIDFDDIVILSQNYGASLQTQTVTQRAITQAIAATSSTTSKKKKTSAAKSVLS